MIALLITAGCNSYVRKGGENVGLTELNNPDFATIQAKILNPYCVACHPGGGGAAGISLDSYAHVKQALAAIQAAVVEKQTMPPGAPLAKDLQTLLLNWIMAGSPRSVTSQFTETKESL